MSNILAEGRWMWIVSQKAAIIPATAQIESPSGVMVSRYPSGDPRWVTDFEDQLAASGAEVLFAAAEGARR